MKEHLFTKAGDPIIHSPCRSYVFEDHAADALKELNQVILHLGRLLDYCTELTEHAVKGVYDIDLPDIRCRFQELRDGEFGDFVNWNAIANAIRATE